MVKNGSIPANQCPTCESKPTEIADGVFGWTPNTYFYGGKKHPCLCESQIELYRHYLLARIPEEYMRYTRDDWIDKSHAIAEVDAYLKQWDSYRKHGVGLGFYSKTQATGKTFLATYIARDVIKRGESVYYAYFRSLVGAYELPAEERRLEEDRLRDCTLLILDEVIKPTTVPQRNLFADRLEELIRHRSNYNKVTIITSNLEPDELDKEYPRTFSLLMAKQKKVTLKGDDVRRDGMWSVTEALIQNGEMRPII